MPGVQWGHWGHLACLALQPNSIPEEEYEELNVKWCNKEVRHELEIMKHIQRELGTWDRGQSRAEVSTGTLSTTQSRGCCLALHGLSVHSSHGTAQILL